MLVKPVLGVLLAGGSLEIPRTPVDHVNGLYARQWVLLEEAKELIPASQTYTAVARNEDEEMLLFMLSLGALPDRSALPTSYWRVPQPGQGDRARYVVSFGCVEPSGPNRLLRRISNGCVFERPRGPH